MSIAITNDQTYSPASKYSFNLPSVATSGVLAGSGIVKLDSTFNTIILFTGGNPSGTGVTLSYTTAASITINQISN